MISLWLLGLSVLNHVHAVASTVTLLDSGKRGNSLLSFLSFLKIHAVLVPKEKSAPNKMESSSDDCDRHRRKRISKSKSSRRRDVYVSPYQPNSSSDKENISDTSVRRKKMPKSKSMYVKGRKIKSWKN